MKMERTQKGWLEKNIKSKWKSLEEGLQAEIHVNSLNVALKKIANWNVLDMKYTNTVSKDSRQIYPAIT